MIRRKGPCLSRQAETTGDYQPGEEESLETLYFCLSILSSLKRSGERLVVRGQCVKALKQKRIALV